MHLYGLFFPLYILLATFHAKKKNLLVTVFNSTINSLPGMAVVLSARSTVSLLPARKLAIGSARKPDERAP